MEPGRPPGPVAAAAPDQGGRRWPWHSRRWTFFGQFRRPYHTGMAAKLRQPGSQDDGTWWRNCWKTLRRRGTRILPVFPPPRGSGQTGGAQPVTELFDLPPALEPGCQRWRQRHGRGNHPSEQRQLASHTAPTRCSYPCNHLVEEALQAAFVEGDYSPFHALLEVLVEPLALSGRAAPLRHAEPRPSR